MPDKPSNYLIEYYVIDNQIKASALDPKTGTEVSIICPASTTRRELSDLAVRKLEYVLKKNAKSQ